MPFSSSNYGGALTPGYPSSSHNTATHGLPTHQGPPTIRRGSQGLYVAYCQNLLNVRLPSPPLWVDGIFGNDTDQRVRHFQAMRGLQVDGIVGLITWNALEAGPPLIQRRPSVTAPAEILVGGF